MDPMIVAGAVACLGLSATGSAFGTGFAASSAVGAWKKCYAANKPAPFILLGLVGAPITQLCTDESDVFHARKSTVQERASLASSSAFSLGSASGSRRYTRVVPRLRHATPRARLGRASPTTSARSA